jgi:hypothetical protein
LPNVFSFSEWFDLTRLIAPADKVVPYFETLVARGNEILTRPLNEYAAVRRAVDDHAVWWASAQQALVRAFEGDLVTGLGKSVAVSFRLGPGAAAEALQAQVRLNLAVVAAALALASQDQK